VTARLLLEMQSRARAAGAAFLVVFVPSDEELAGEAPDAPTAAAHALLRRLARERGLAVLDLGPELAARGRGLRFAGDDHPDARGHRRIAEAVFLYLVRGAGGG
jgi:lysophospholipase L1-like esterase